MRMGAGAKRSFFFKLLYEDPVGMMFLESKQWMVSYHNYEMIEKQ